MVNILFFGQLADIAQQELGQSEINWPLPNKSSQMTLAELRLELSKKSPLLSEQLNKNSNLCAVNQTLCHNDNINTMIIRSDDEIAFMSPLSGG